MLFFIFLIKIFSGRQGRVPQMVITETPPEIIPLDESITYNIRTSNDGVVTVTTLDQENTQGPQRDIITTTGNQEIIGYAPTVEEINNSLAHPIIKTPELQSLENSLLVNNSSSPQQSSELSQNSQTGVLFQSNSSPSTSSLQSSVDPVTSSNSPVETVTTVSPSMTSLTNANPLVESPTGTSSNTSVLGSDSKTTKTTNQTEKSKTKKDKKDKKKKKANTTNDDSEVISNGEYFDYNIIQIILDLIVTF